MPLDWRLPENRREAFLRFYGFHIQHKAHPGMVYSWLPAIAEAYALDQRQLEWLTWLNGCTQNPVMSLILLEEAPYPENWVDAALFFDENFTKFDFDTDRRHQKSKFVYATGQWLNEFPEGGWERAERDGWTGIWEYAFSQPYMGRLSAWSMLEYARILGLHSTDAQDLLLQDKTGSKSHRAGLALLAGAPLEAAYWDWDQVTTVYDIKALEELGYSLWYEARQRFGEANEDITYLTLESALCTWKSWHKPNRRYPGVYADMAYLRLKKAEARFGHRFDVLWESRKKDLPDYLRLEDRPRDPGLCAEKQNVYLETGGVPVLFHEYPDMLTAYDVSVETEQHPYRKDPRWS